MIISVRLERNSQKIMYYAYNAWKNIKISSYSMVYNFKRYLVKNVKAIFLGTINKPNWIWNELNQSAYFDPIWKVF